VIYVCNAIGNCVQATVATPSSAPTCPNTVGAVANTPNAAPNMDIVCGFFTCAPGLGTGKLNVLAEVPTTVPSGYVQANKTEP